MNKYDEKIKSLAIDAIKKTKSQLDEKFGSDKLFGYSLCTDDCLMTIYHVACTNSWAEDNKEFCHSSVEWRQSGDDTLFDQTYDEMANHYEKNDDDACEFFELNRDIRYESLVQALKECRESGVFDDSTYLTVVSTDPSEDLQTLEMKAVDRINKPSLADKFGLALDIIKYR